MKCHLCPCDLEQHLSFVNDHGRRPCCNCSCADFMKRIPSRYDYYMGIADAVSKRSRDESTELGAILVGPAGEIRSTGYNSFPRGINDRIAARQQRPLKYKWFVHAEANAIFNAARVGTGLDGCTLYCAWPPCPGCAQGIIQVGVVEVVVRSLEVPERWQGDMDLSMKMLEEAGVVIRDC